MAKLLNNVQRAQQYLKKIFRLLNEQIFDNELEDVQVVLSNNSRVYGYYTLNNATWTGQANGEQFAQHEIGISSQYLASRSVCEVVANGYIPTRDTPISLGEYLFWKGSSYYYYDTRKCEYNKEKAAELAATFPTSTEEKSYRYNGLAWWIEYK